MEPCSFDMQKASKMKQPRLEATPTPVSHRREAYCYSLSYYTQEMYPFNSLRTQYIGSPDEVHSPDHLSSKQQNANTNKNLYYLLKGQARADGALNKTTTKNETIHRLSRISILGYTNATYLQKKQHLHRLRPSLS